MIISLPPMDPMACAKHRLSRRSTFGRRPRPQLGRCARQWTLRALERVDPQTPHTTSASADHICFGAADISHTTHRRVGSTSCAEGTCGHLPKLPSMVEHTLIGSMCPPAGVVHIATPLEDLQPCVWRSTVAHTEPFLCRAGDDPAGI